MADECWRFSGNQFASLGPERPIEYFACGSNGRFQIEDTIAYPVLDVGNTVNGYSFPKDIIFRVGTETATLSASDTPTLTYTYGDCSNCKSKYDCINGACYPNSTYGTPGYYNSADECAAKCGKGDQIAFKSISVPIFSNCDPSGKPVNIMQDIDVIEGSESCELLKFEQFASVQGKINCDLEVVSCTPDSWKIRPEWHRPQVIYQFAEINNQGIIIGAPKYQLTIPHHNDQKPAQGLPNYQKGNWEIIYVLKDNSKITIHSFNEEEGMKILTAAKLRVIEDYLTNSYLSKSSLVHTQTPIAQINVKNRMAKYYPMGIFTEIPKWIAKW